MINMWKFFPLVFHLEYFSNVLNVLNITNQNNIKGGMKKYAYF